MTHPTATALPALTASLHSHGVGDARLALVLGSGLGRFAERLDGARQIPYAELDGMPQSSVPGHAGRLVLGEVDGVSVVVQQGRVHLYEGWSAREVTRAVRAFANLGIGGIVLTNAAGGLDADWETPSLMRVSDHVNMQPVSLGERASALESGDQRRRDVVYDPVMGDVLDSVAEEVGNPLFHGIYAGLLGPSYETPAEIRMVRSIGASAVGMSTVLEAVAARNAGMRVCAVSCITNQAAGIGEEPLSHEEVVAAGEEIAERFCTLLGAAVRPLAEALESP
jgi:purine-nucleoside phosphorylase